MLNEDVKEELIKLKNELTESFKTLKQIAEKDIPIKEDEFDIDAAVLRTPKLLHKYNGLFSDNTLRLKELYSFFNKTKLERWKYWSGKQTDRYYADNGIVHEKILKSDLDKYISADEKIILVNEIVAVQKSIVDYLETCIKEIQSRNYHCRVAVDWRKFISGGM